MSEKCVAFGVTSRISLIFLAVLFVYGAIRTAFALNESTEFHSSIERVRICQSGFVSKLVGSSRRKAFDTLWSGLPSLTYSCLKGFPFEVERISSKTGRRAIYHLKEQTADGYSPCFFASVNVRNEAEIESKLTSERCQLIVAGTDKELLSTENVTFYEALVSSSNGNDESALVARLDLPSFLSLFVPRNRIDHLIVDTDEDGFRFSKYLYRYPEYAHGEDFYFEKMGGRTWIKELDVFPRRVHKDSTFATFDFYGLEICQVSLRYRRPSHPAYEAHFNEMVHNVLYMQHYVLLRAESTSTEELWITFLNIKSNYCRKRVERDLPPPI